MAHYAFLDENDIVVEVIVGRDENEIVDGISDWEKHYAEFRGLKCVRTSYNTVADNHLLGGEPFRKNYAAVGYHFDGIGFYAPQPYPSWSFNSSNYTWEAPVPRPTTGFYAWDETTVSWVEIPTADE